MIGGNLRGWIAPQLEFVHPHGNKYTSYSCTYLFTILVSSFIIHRIVEV